MADWHWDHGSGRRVPTKRRSHLARLLGRLVPKGVVLLWATAIAVWAWGVGLFVNGSYWGGGALIFAGCLLLMLWAGGGWRWFRAALEEWLNGPS